MTVALVLLALLGGWEAYVGLGGIDELLLPAPSAIAVALVDDRALLWSNFVVTGERDRARASPRRSCSASRARSPCTCRSRCAGRCIRCS